MLEIQVVLSADLQAFISWGYWGRMEILTAVPQVTTENKIAKSPYCQFGIQFFHETMSLTR